MGLWNRLRGWLRSMFGNSTIESRLGVQPLQSDDMSAAIERWARMYSGKPEHSAKKNDQYTNLPAVICQEIINTTILEMSSEIVGNDELNRVYQGDVVSKIRDYAEYAYALGGGVFKPYQTQGGIRVEFVEASNFLALKANRGKEMTGAVFFDAEVVGDVQYMRAEIHTFNEDEQSHTIKNKAFRGSVGSSDLGEPVPLAVVERWAPLEPVLTINNVERPLYGHFKPAIANNIDPQSPLGVSIFARAEGAIRRADQQLTALAREFRVKEAKQYVDETAVPPNRKLPYNDDNYYIKLNASGGEKKDFFETYSPTINDENFLRTLNEYKREIEDCVGLARGTLSEVDGEAKTATELRIMRQRTYSTITNNQRNLEKALSDLVYAMSVFDQLSKKGGRTTYDVKTTFDDSVVDDAETRLRQLLELYDAGLASDLDIRRFYFKEDAETAKKALAEIAKRQIDTMRDPDETQFE